MRRMLLCVFIFGLAYVFNYKVMASSLAKGFSIIGNVFHREWRLCSASSSCRFRY